MSTAELKYSLHNIIDTSEDKSMLSKAYALLSSLTTKNKRIDDYNSLPLKLKEAIEEGIIQLDNGEGISYEAFREKVKKQYNL
ncbi:MAG: hypothetical protein J0M08_04555 [Bacteroidetes bacterium]|nr:hypothetical protein [Bacteroidota bacterium]